LNLKVFGLWATLGIALYSSARAASPGNCLLFNGTNGFVSVAHNTNLNAYPLAVTAWFRTTNSSSFEGIVSKYADASADGWSLAVSSGHLRGFYYRNHNFSDFAIDSTSAISVSDGFWHHAALVVDASGGKIYVDGVLAGTSAWTGAAGGPGSSEPLQIGRYYTNTAPFQATIDEVAVWNRGLGSGELNYLKHRQLNGNEDGLVALWHFDEGSGTTTADATGHGYTGILTNSPQWVNSTAPVVFSSLAGSALSLNGANQFVAVAQTNDLNAYPLTVTAWIKTSRTNANYDAIINKYFPASNNGYSLHLVNNRLYAFYFRNGSSYVYAGDPGLDGGVVADGQWHHVAYTVGPGGGKIFVDGAQVNSLGWTGSAGAPSTPQPVSIGQYPSFGSFQGQMDEVTIWNRELSLAEIQAMQHARLVGNETNLVAYWRFDEGSGTTTADFTGLGHTGMFSNSPAWTGSTAFLGDGTSTIHAELGPVQWTRLFAIQTIPASQGFAASASEWIRRLDDFNAAANNTNVVASVQSALQGTIAGAIPLINNTAQSNLIFAPFNAAAPQLGAGGTKISAVLNIQPSVQLDSVNDTFALTAGQAYGINGGSGVATESATLAPVQLLHFDGNLYFGAIQTTFTNIFNAPTRGSLSGGGINTTLSVVGNSGTVVANPAYHYGNGSFLGVVLLPNGDSIANPGTVVNLVGSDTGCVQNICFNRTSLTLSNNAFRGAITLQLPVGFSVCTNFSDSSRLTVAQLPFGTALLDTNMVPQTNSLVRSGSIAAVAETWPFWIQGSSLNWQVQAGQILLPNPAGILFVRQDEDDTLTAQKSTLVDTNTGNRVSNDGYYRNAGLGSNLVTVIADPNGIAQVSTAIALNPPELRPHFPYSGRTNGLQLPTTIGGQLVLLNSAVDTLNSFLLVSNALPALYARDCFDTNCGSASISPALLAFSAAGNRLNLTTDGGLLAYGSVPPANLTWGFAGGGNYAQRTSDVQSGAWSMAGTFLLANQTSLLDAQRPTVLLFSGFGDASDPTYLERPGQAAYSDGLANYPGLNFRQPTTGQSFIAKQNAGPYQLSSRSKYYARFGGISGIHEADPFSSPSMTLYGYPFTFTSYRLSYLDSENWESRTDGALSLPGPAGFMQEFSRMKFVCKGDLDSAQVPPFTPAKHMVYWNTDILPLSIDFHPTNNDVCGASDRFLVLGVQSKLPFLGQAFHATLGFKNTGNLVTPADNVAGVDSRFRVPGHLTLQGPGNSSFSLETAGDGYFNNWDRADKPDSGFYNLAGKIRLPFFQDTKVHLHVTPTGPTTSQIDIMGGWPGPNDNSADQGWSINGSNFFNTAKFDLHHDSWPLGVSLTDYRHSPTDQYHARAQRDWIQVAKFDYPIQWNPVLLQFAGSQTKKVVLPVIDVDSRLKSISPGKVDFDFSQDISVQLPVLKVLDFANDALNEINGPINSVSNAIRAEFNGAVSATGLTSGFRSLQNVLREDASGFFRPVVQPALAPVVDQLYTLLAEMERTNAAGFFSKVVPIVTGASNNLKSAIQSINGSDAQANSVVGQVNQTLSDVDNTIGLFLRILQKDSNGDRHAIETIIKKIVSDQGPALGVVASIADPILNDLLKELEPSLAKIETELTTLRDQVAQVRAQVSGATGDISVALNSAVNDGQALQSYVQTASVTISNLLSSRLTAEGDFFSAEPGIAKQAIQEQLIIAFLSSPLPGNYQKTFRQFFFDDNFILDQLTDVLFDQINRSIRDGLPASGNDGIFAAMKGIGAMSQSLLSAKIRGAPTFQGDSLRRIHLDAAVQMNLPDEMHFNAYMDIKELTSENTPLDCIPPGAPAAEVTLGAQDVPLSWAGISPAENSPPLTLTVQAQWTLQSGSVLGIGGLFDIKGEAGFKGCSVKEIGATFAIGELENYFAAKAAGTIIILGIPVDVQAGLFAGHACSLDPLKFIDPNCDKVLNNPAQFSGLYVQYGGGLSLSQILFGESSCWLDVRANASTALFYEGGPRSGKIGFRQQDGIDLELGCVISGSVDLALGASATFTPPTSYELDLEGDARLCGKLGACPICVEGCKGITIKGVVKDGGIDYFIDF
jgi:hypothetical protein